MTQWIAGRDRVAHLVSAGFVRSACGTRSTDPRWAWPPTARCRDCLATLEPVVRRMTPPVARTSGGGLLAAGRLSAPGSPLPSPFARGRQVDAAIDSRPDADGDHHHPND